ncbi:proteasome accessory factor PafA2 family protein [Bifidobacterium sp. B4081]|uniref:proteasome accessory factor PafA2 family protein n=1 Tax=unclassified Bifidobacterium TaxID=2608897 RepID=UPI00226AFA68|nr:MULTISPECIES: proteasome accessory factor PafA2 family protein [unclassified Bifidobacterium]MCX8643404.1 proteasome accessory factor PafA2 family protein [Bifidobacterium sp. B4077]MCX8645586.1 proteasome accessory factor PafA2 family protein [Bifidobacterium sp. B4081]MCX8668704.1 proteasome accessory factor PafA2 family protein [Bifidobacterium sp. B3998]
MTDGHGTDSDFRRIFGIETEYGLSLTGASGPYAAGRVAMAMFRPLIEKHGSTNIYLPNGARLYLDVGSHPEYATAEARNPLTALKQVLAGERIMTDLAERAGKRLTEDLGRPVKVHVFANNVDARDHAFGCHENYLLDRGVPLDMIGACLVPFLVTRQLITGAGRLDPDGFQISQRADFLDEAVSSATTRARPMVNTRDEPLADPERWRRLHVIVGDTNRSPLVTWFKMASTHVVLNLIEQACRQGRRPDLADWALADPRAAVRAVSRDRTGRVTLELQASTKTGSISALGLQEAYWSACKDLVDQQEDIGIDRPQALQALRLWRVALDALDAGRWQDLADWVDWAAKLRLIQGLSRREAGRDLAEALDLDYHDLSAGRSFPGLIRHGLMRSPVDDSEIRRAMDQPPEDTRARLRGDFVRAADRGTRSWSCDWSNLVLGGSHRVEVALPNPFDHLGPPRYHSLMDFLKNAAEPRA